MYRALALLAVTLPLATSAFARPHHRPRTPARPAPSCAPAELRISAERSTWFDLYVDGRLMAESRTNRGPLHLFVEPGHHHIVVTDFMGDTWSVQDVRVGCGEVLVAEVLDRRGLEPLTRYSEPPPSRRRCSASTLTVAPRGNTWFDLYVDGELVAESRNFDGPVTVRNLAAGTHHVRVTSFVGEQWSDDWIQVGCGSQVAAEVREDRGLRVF